MFVYQTYFFKRSKTPICILVIYLILYMRECVKSIENLSSEIDSSKMESKMASICY